MFKFRNTDDLKEVAVTVSTETFVRLALLTVISIVLFFTIKKAEHALLIIFVAFFLALALNAPVFWLSSKIPGKRRGSRAIATTLSFLAVIIVIGILLAVVLPPLIRQTDSLIKEAPKLVADFRNQNSPIGKFIRHYHLQKEVNNFSSQLSSRLQHAGGTAFNTAKHVGSSIFSLVTILVLTFMMLIEGPRWIKFIRGIVPETHHKMIDRMSEDMYEVIKGFVNGQVLLAALAALLITPAVLLLHISYAAALVVVIFICGLIPMVGHTIGAVIVTLVALFHSTSSAAIILAYYLFYMQIEAYIIQPRVQANSTNMSPLLVFMSLVIGLSFGGLFGGLVAIPVAGCLRIVVLEYLFSTGLIDAPEFHDVTKLGTK
jgi:predicted PurR-regulated permease PerM